MTAFVTALGWAAVAIVAVLLVTYAAARAVGKHSVIDIAWGVLFGAAAVASYAATTGSGDGVRRGLLLAMAVIWGGRLALHIGRRSRGKPEDPRYVRLLASRGPLSTALIVYGLQGTLALIIAQPLIVGMTTDGRVTWLAWAGVALWAVGLAFEAIGDWQLERYKADPDRGPVMDRGLWRYTRHPNYFGDACVWVGIFLVAAEAWPGVLTVFSPIVMVYLLVFGSGKALLERQLGGRPGWDDYRRRTSGFFPLPPRSSR